MRERCFLLTFLVVSIAYLFVGLGLSSSYSDPASQEPTKPISRIKAKNSKLTKSSSKVTTAQKEESPPKSEFEISIEQLEFEIMEDATKSLTNRSITKEQLKVVTKPVPPEQKKIKRAINQNLILPPPRHTNSTTAILVLSSENHFVRRQAIRELWGKGHDNVYFVVGHSNCLDQDIAAIANNVARSLPGDDSRYEAPIEPPPTCRYQRHAFLYHEQLRYQDLLEVPLEEFYKGLPDKLVYSYKWVLEKLPSHVEWIAKVDDDMFVRVKSLEHYVRKYNPNVPIVIGKINQNVKAVDHGKWAELDYEYTLYPYFPRGSAGHVVNRVVAKYIATHEGDRLFRYQGEDTSVGIWLQEGNDKYHDLESVTYIDAKTLFTNDFVSRCADPKTIIVGHDLIIQDLLDCYQYADEGPRDKVYFDQSANYVDHSTTRQKRVMPKLNSLRG